MPCGLHPSPMDMISTKEFWIFYAKGLDVMCRRDTSWLS